jgi:hypothetical protein
MREEVLGRLLERVVITARGGSVLTNVERACRCFAADPLKQGTGRRHALRGATIKRHVGRSTGGEDAAIQDQVRKACTCRMGRGNLIWTK